MLLMVPILLSIYIRIYRVKRVFELYEKFLDKVRMRTGSVYSYATSWNTKYRAMALRNSLDEIGLGAEIKITAQDQSSWR